MSASSPSQPTPSAATGESPFAATTLHARYIAPDFWQAYVAAGGAHDDAPSPHAIGIVDLTSDYRKALRKSYRSLVNWGKRNFVVGTASIDLVRGFHAEIAGRVTRPKESWDVMGDHVRRGGGEILAGFLYNKLAGAAVFIDGEDTSIYWTGVYDRDVNCHCLLWLALERAKERGMRTMVLGEIPDKGSVPEKEYQIGFYKRGFCTHVIESGGFHVRDRDGCLLNPARGLQGRDHTC